IKINNLLRLKKDAAKKFRKIKKIKIIFKNYTTYCCINYVRALSDVYHLLGSDSSDTTAVASACGELDNKCVGGVCNVSGVISMLPVTLCHYGTEKACFDSGETLLLPWIAYCFHKYFIYECLLTRLQASFAGSTYAYKGSLPMALHAIFFVATAVHLLWFFFLKDAIIDTYAHQLGIGKRKQFYFPPLICLGVVDIVLNALLVYCFSKPLIKLTRQQHWYIVGKEFELTATTTATMTDGLSNTNTGANASNNNAHRTTETEATMAVHASQESKSHVHGTSEMSLKSLGREPSAKTKEFMENSTLYDLLVRVNVITWTMVLVTTFNLLMVFFQVTSIIFAIDIVLNCLGLMFAFRKYRPAYQVICCCCHHTLSQIGARFLFLVDLEPVSS
ncbi:hypothetical protein RFI_14623, partial [Reticulomyxa filosa]